MVRRICSAVLAVLVAAGCALALFLPAPSALPARADGYLCAWEDGEQTEESYYSAYSALYGAGEEGVVLSRGGRTGEVAGGSAYRIAYGTLARAPLAPLLSLSKEGLRPLERAALMRTFSTRIWYDGEYYHWTGSRVARTECSRRAELVFLSGSLSGSVLRDTGAAVLELREAEEVSPLAFRGSSVTACRAFSPYVFENGALYLQTEGGRRLVAALPGLETLAVSDAAFADEGALIACENLRELTLPFLGNMLSSHGTEKKGEFAHLFLLDGAYCVPKTLQTVRVTGGALLSHAFYAAPFLEEIVACGLEAEAISRTAFVDVTSLRVLHSPRADVTLRFSFTASRAACGCTVFTRTGD